jgi:hypothetical protein
MSEPRLPDELNELESALRGLRPKCDLPGRDRLMFEAGRRAGRPNRLWPATSGMLAAALVVALWPRAPVGIDPMMVIAPPTEMRPGDVNDSSASYIRTRNAVIRFGPDALPAVTFPVSEPGNVPTPLTARFREDV